jgi:hypothetical protein
MTAPPPPPPPPPDLNALLEALRTAESSRGADAGYTTTDLVTILGISRRRAHALLHTLMAQGRLVAGVQYRRALDGRLARHCVYRLVD